MVPEHDTDHGYHNPSNPQPTISVDCKLVTHKDKSLPSETMKNEDDTDIMDKLAAMMRPPKTIEIINA